VAEPSGPNGRFVTVAMVEILLSQQLLDEAEPLIAALTEKTPDDPRILVLRRRIEALRNQGPLEPVPVDETGMDRIRLTPSDRGLGVVWEVIDASLALARRRARYSGRPVVRLFSAVPGPRGVRHGIRDLAIEPGAAGLDWPGLPAPAVHVAAVGFLANTGEFVPLAHSDPIVDWQ
jgi:hypothetical protein